MQALGGQTLGLPQIILCTPSMVLNSHTYPSSQVVWYVIFCVLDGWMYMGGIGMNPSVYNKYQLLGKYCLFLPSHQGTEVLCT